MAGAQRMSLPRVSRMTKKLRDEADKIASIRQDFIVNRPIAGGHRGSLDLKDRRTDPYLKGVSDGFVRDDRLQLIVCFDQRNSIFFLKKSEDRMQPQIVADDLLSQRKRQICLVKRDRDTAGEPHPLDLHHLCSLRQLKAFCNAGRGGNGTLMYHTGGGFSSGRIHVLDETRQLCELRVDPRRQNEGSKSTTNLEQTSTGQILDRTTNSDAAHLKSLKQSIFGR